MATPVDPFNDPETLFGRLRAASQTQWDAYCNHEFVRGIDDGSLPEKCFRHYLEQDYLFLIHFSRAWALAVYKSDHLADMRAAAVSLNATLNYEMQVHVKYCRGWGLEERQMQEIEESRANMAYTRYVLDRGLSGDILDLHVALAPCIMGYAVIGKRLLENPAADLSSNPYKEWIQSYGAEEYQNVALAAIGQLDRLAAAHMGPGRFDGLSKTFRQATSLEIGFWDMGLNLEI